jgi:DNA-binding NarL/FixJ family response regulator
VLVVDDDEGLRTLVSVVLESAGLETIEAATGEQALAVARDAAPRLVVLDICLPGISGYQVCRELRDRYGDGLPIIFISGVRTESFDRVAGLLVGADDYLEKPFAPDELLIRVQRHIRRSSPFVGSVAAKLTRREREVLGLLADGLAVRDIAQRLVLSPKTVGAHMENILRKLGVRSRTHAVAIALRHDLLVRETQREDSLA